MAESITKAEIQARLVRYPDLRPCTTAFIDTRTPGSEKKENFTIIGPGVAENPDQFVHIDIPHGFNIGGARQPPGCVNSQHSHETAEVFVVQRGRWRFTVGEKGQDAFVDLEPGDTISIPTHVFRGFTNVGNELGFLFAVLGGDDPGRVTWAPYVFEQAAHHGLVLLENGRLIDTQAGEQVPTDVAPMTATTSEDVEKLSRLSTEELAKCVVRTSEMNTNAEQLEGWSGITEAPIIGEASIKENRASGKLSWPHGFHVRRLVFEPGAETDFYRREEAEVIMMHEGTLHYCWPEGDLLLETGDVLTSPIGTNRRYRNMSMDQTVVYVVRGTNTPQGFLAPN
ncbi:MAG: cupin domain-containing protein [Pseudomonadota bacterium]